MRRPFRASGRTKRDAGSERDPSVQVVHDAIAFTTAAIACDAAQIHRIAIDALATDPDGFVDALATTIAMLAEEADEHGADLCTFLRDIALGVNVAAIAETSEPDHTDHTDHPEA